MTNKEILDIAMQQSAYDTNAKASDFLMGRFLYGTLLNKLELQSFCQNDGIKVR